MGIYRVILAHKGIMSRTEWRGNLWLRMDPHDAKAYIQNTIYYWLLKEVKETLFLMFILFISDVWPLGTACSPSLGV